MTAGLGARPGNVPGAEHNLLMATAEGTADADALLAFLDAQRECVLATVGGLDESLLTTPVLPSGWTPLGLVEHLGHAERHWFQEVALIEETARHAGHLDAARELLGGRTGLGPG